MRKLSQVEKADLISLLVEALADEWVSMLRYKIHSSKMRGVFGQGIADHLDEHADDEQEHAERLTKHFYSHGLPINVDIPEFTTGNEPVEMINLDLEGEIQAIERYVKIIALCEDIHELTDTRMLIEDILIDEVEHQDDDASFIRAKIADKETALEGPAKVAAVSALVKAANIADDLGLEEFGNKYTIFASEI